MQNVKAITNLKIEETKKQNITFDYTFFGKERKKERKKERNLLTTLDVFHGNKLLGLLVPHEPGHPKIPSSQILDSLILFHNQIPRLNQRCYLILRLRMEEKGFKLET